MKASKAGKIPSALTAAVVPTGTLLHLKTSDIKPSSNNPRVLFDPEPLHDLRESIRNHGVLVPITVYPLRGQAKYAILDGERRYRCCVDLEAEHLEIEIPANVVEPPDQISGLLYMFSIHNLREQWELMPTALSLKVVMEKLNETDSRALVKLTSLSEPQIERCKMLLTFPERYQRMSMDPDPTKRIPANFWIEARPILDLCVQEIPALAKELGRDGILDRLVEKYHAKKVKSVIHFRRIMEAVDLAEDQLAKRAVLDVLGEYIRDVQLETRKAFDGFVVDNKRVQGAIRACEEFVTKLGKSRLEHAVDKEELTLALKRVQAYVTTLLEQLAGSDAPEPESLPKQGARPTEKK